MSFLHVFYWESKAGQARISRDGSIDPGAGSGLGPVRSAASLVATLQARVRRPEHQNKPSTIGFRARWSSTLRPSTLTALGTPD
jgi:hypothetical protein